MKKCLSLLLVILMLCTAGMVPASATEDSCVDSGSSGILLTALQWTWGLPQNIVGGLMYLLLDKYKTERFHDAYVVYVKPFQLFGYDPGHGWVTLGKFIFEVGERYETAEEYRMWLESYYPWRLEWYNILLREYQDYPNVTIGSPVAYPYAEETQDDSGATKVIIYPPLDPFALSEAEIAELFLKYNDYESDNGIIHHEYGHALQSAMLGPLYLPLIGLPSFLVSQDIVRYDGNNFDFYTEKWANILSDAYLGK